MQLYVCIKNTPFLPAFRAVFQGSVGIQPCRTVSGHHTHHQTGTDCLCVQMMHQNCEDPHETIAVANPDVHEIDSSMSKAGLAVEREILKHAEDVCLKARTLTQISDKKLLDELVCSTRNFKEQPRFALLRVCGFTNASCSCT